MANPLLRYSEFPPPPEVAPWVACSWELSIGKVATPYRHRVLPDGCMDLVWSPGAGLRVAGPNTTAFLTTMPPESSATGVRFKPGGAPAFLGVPAAGLLDAFGDPGDLWGTSAAPLEDAVGLAETPLARRTALLAWLEERVREAVPLDPLVDAATARLTAGPMNVASLADELGYSERHLHRSVVAAVGYGPKRLARILRLQRALAAGSKGTRRGVSLARLAHDNGFADQAHFSRECLGLAGAKPSTLLAR